MTLESSLNYCKYKKSILIEIWFDNYLFRFVNPSQCSFNVIVAIFLEHSQPVWRFGYGKQRYECDYGGTDENRRYSVPIEKLAKQRGQQNAQRNENTVEAKQHRS